MKIVVRPRRAVVHLPIFKGLCLHRIQRDDVSHLPAGVVRQRNYIGINTVKQLESAFIDNGLRIAYSQERAVVEEGNGRPDLSTLKVKGMVREMGRHYDGQSLLPDKR